MKVGIIGGGATGTVVLHELARAVCGGAPISEIIVLDESGFDGGLAYRTPCEHHLLNMKVGTMSAVAQDDGHFVRWLRGAGHDCIGGEHLPRHLYRRYLADLRGECAARCQAAGADVRLRGLQATGLRSLGRDGWRIDLAGGATLAVDAVILCTGHNAPEDHYGLAACGNFFADPYAPMDIPDEPGIRVGILGTGLSAIDNAVALGQALRHASITCISRNGRFPKVQPPVPVVANPLFQLAVAAYIRKQDVVRAEPLARCIEAALREHAGIALDFTSPGTAPDGAAQLEHDVAEAEAGIANTYSYLAGITDLVCEAWRRMEHDERSSFMRHVYSGWMRNRHAMPLVNARKLRTLARAGRLHLAAGITGAARAGAGFEVAFADHRTAGFDVLISAIGPSYDVAASRLYRDAAQDGVLQIDPFGGIVCAHPDGRVHDGAGRPQHTLFAVGSPTRGSFFYAAAMDINVARTRAMTESLLHSLMPQGVPTTLSLEPLSAEG